MLEIVLTLAWMILPHQHNADILQDTEFTFHLDVYETGYLLCTQTFC